MKFKLLLAFALVELNGEMIPLANPIETYRIKAFAYFYSIYPHDEYHERDLDLNYDYMNRFSHLKYMLVDEV